MNSNLKLSQEEIDKKIKDVEFHHYPNLKTSVCFITLDNNFTVLGHSSCVSKENFDEAIGEKYALINAKEQIWQLEGYLLQQKLFENK